MILYIGELRSGQAVRGVENREVRKRAGRRQLKGLDSAPVRLRSGQALRGNDRVVTAAGQAVRGQKEVEKWRGKDMAENLYQVASEYVKILERIETTDDVSKLQRLEERRVELHWRFIELLKQQGIEYKDRDHATRIAIRIAKEEL